MGLQKILIKFFITGLTFFLLLCTSSMGFYQELLQGGSRQEDPVPYIFGLIGENGWYITTVTVVFVYNPDIVREIRYYLNNKWNVYNGPFNVSNNGIYKISWFWIDKKGETHDVLIPISFKIDQSPPTIKLTRKLSGKDKVVFTANVNDDTSLVERVEFYLDDVLQLTVNESPYQFTFVGKDQHYVYAIGYNFAGLSQKSKNLSTPRLQVRNHNFRDIVFIFMQKIFSQFY